MQNQYEVIQQFKNFIHSNGAVPPDYIKTDTRDFVRFNPRNGKLNGDVDAGYKLHTDNKPTGLFQDFRIHDTPIKWVYKPDKSEYTPSQYDRKAIEQKRAQEQLERLELRKQAAIKAQYIYQNAKPITDKNQHAYLQRKNVNPFICRIDKYDNLIIPFFSLNSNEICTIQYIKPDGSKLFLKDSEKGYSFLGDKSSIPQSNLIKRGLAVNHDYIDLILIAEGFADAACIYQETGYFTIIAGDCNNIAKVVEKLKTLTFRDLKIMFIFDSDDASENGINRAIDVLGDDSKVTLAKPICCYTQETFKDFNDFYLSNNYTPTRIKNLIDTAIYTAF